MYCKECGHQIADDSKFCASCGKSQNVKAVSISENLNKIKQEYLFEYIESENEPKSKMIALLLCIFGGGLGLHRFYVGKTGTGILMLLMWVFVIFGMTLSDKAEMNAIFETGRGLSEAGNTIVTISAILGIILVIWVLIDLIRILTGSFTRVPKTPEKESSQSFDLDSFLTSKKTSENSRDFSFTTAPLFIVGILVIAIIVAILHSK